MSQIHGPGPVTGPSSASAAGPRSRHGAPLDGLSVAAHFVVEIDDRQLSCARVTGLQLGSDLEELTSRTDPEDRERILWSAPASPGRLVLTRALDGDRTLFGWRKEAMSGKPAVRTIAIRHLEHAGGQTLHTWEVTSAWPLRWAGPQYDALHGGVALEELEIVFHDITWHGA